MTEDEARTKWCPFARTVESYGTAPEATRPRNRVVKFERSDRTEDAVVAIHNLIGCCCIASDCMAFRWLPDATKDLGNGIIAIVDEVDKDLLKGIWFDGRYPKHQDGYLHRLIVTRLFGSIPEGMLVDHIDGDKLNNRRGNLRVVTHTDNAANSASRGGKSQYRGVFQQASGRWSAQISRSGIRMSLGTWDTEDEAAGAYDKAAQEIHGEFARLNLTEITNSGRQGYCGLAGRPD